ncbi:hypothetical protein ABVT39_000066 [Epinephelus coioides]
MKQHSTKSPVHLNDNHNRELEEMPASLQRDVSDAESQSTSQFTAQHQPQETQCLSHHQTRAGWHNGGSATHSHLLPLAKSQLRLIHLRHANGPYVDLNGTPFRALVDTGSNISLVCPGTLPGTWFKTMEANQAPYHHSYWRTLKNDRRKISLSNCC